MPQLTNMMLAWGNVARMVEYVASANFSLMALCKLVGTWYHGETLRTLMISIVTDWMTSTNNRERNTMLNIAKRGRALSVRCFVTMTGTVTFYISLNLLKFYRNVHQPQRNLVYRFSYPYNTQNTPNYEITFFTQLSGGMYSAMINCTIDTFVSILVLHICAQLINLRMALNNLVDELAKGSISSSRFKKGLIMITMRHEHLIRNANTVDECYSAVLFVHMLAATFQLCFESFQVFTIVTSHVDVPIIKMAFLSFYFTLVLTHLYFYCYSAERLLTEPQRNLVYRLEIIQNSPNYEITYIIQLFGGAYAVFANYTIDSFVSVLVLHVCSQLINLRITINNLVNELANNSISSSRKERFKKSLAAIVIRHEHLIRNAKTIDCCYSSVLFMNLLITTLQMCFIAFQIFTLTNLRTTLNNLVNEITNDSISKESFKKGLAAIVVRHEYLISNAKTIDSCYSSLLFMNIFFAILQMCFIAFQIFTSTNMAYGVYECKWYNLPSKDAKDLMFIVYRSKIPLKLTAGKFGIFSIEMFGSSPNYEITYFIQLFGAMYTAFANSTIDSFISVLVLQVCAQLINLRTMLNNLVNKLANKSISSLTFREGLAAIIVRHDHLIRYVLESLHYLTLQ
ncbi:uncharacterized protein [Mycetomoellerius zeteki]|nr:PREDICTED: uncharacterized protein LOC108723692 [Trachymyrmex zeteki]